LDDPERLGIAREATGKPRDRVYVYQEYLDILNRDEGSLPVATGAGARSAKRRRKVKK